MTNEEWAAHKMWKKNYDELFTEYPFFRDGMTGAEFDEEQEAYIAFYLAGGKPKDYKSLWKQRHERQE